MRLSEVPRHPLGQLPTPLHPAPRISAELGVDVWIKRDDLTGVGVGGNKVRTLEYLFGDALERGCDTFVTAAGEDSNYAAIAALAGARAGIEVHLVRYGDPRTGPAGGNPALVELAGARCHHTGDPDRTSVDPFLERLAARLRRGGRRPYVAGRGGATPVGCLGYVRASLELDEQLAAAAVEPTRVLLATGSCGTQAGLEVGRRRLRAGYRIVGVAVSRPVAETERRVTDLAVACGELLGLTPAAPTPHILDGYRGPGYGIASEAGRAAMLRAARLEGLVLDPVFTAKAFAALLDTATEDQGPIVFWHTGGAANALWASGEGGF